MKNQKNTQDSRGIEKKNMKSAIYKIIIRKNNQKQTSVPPKVPENTGAVFTHDSSGFVPSCHRRSESNSMWVKY